jgi:hypothetical protein
MEKDEELEKQIELMTSCSYDDWDINQHYCWKVQCSRCKLRKPPNLDGSEFTYGDCREYARKKADEIKVGERSSECETPKYEKFMVLYNKPGNPPNAIPWTGLDQTMQFVHDKLEEGYVVQVKPFTREEWAKD